MIQITVTSVEIKQVFTVVPKCFLVSKGLSFIVSEFRVEQVE